MAGTMRAFAHGPANDALQPQDIAHDEPVVAMHFPRKVILTLENHSRVVFHAGKQEVPESLVNHPYLKAHGVQRVEPIEEPEEDDEDSDETVEGDETETSEGEEQNEPVAVPKTTTAQNGKGRGKNRRRR